MAAGRPFSTKVSDEETVAAHMAAPWLARGGGGAARAFYAGSGALLGISFGLMGAVPLIAMWGPDKRRNDAPDT